VGGRGYGAGYARGAGGSATVTSVTASGSSTFATANQTSGAGGYGKGVASGGAGASSTLTNVVSGSTTGGTLHRAGRLRRLWRGRCERRCRLFGHADQCSDRKDHGRREQLSHAQASGRWRQRRRHCGSGRIRGGRRGGDLKTHLQRRDGEYQARQHIERQQRCLWWPRRDRQRLGQWWCRRSRAAAAMAPAIRVAPEALAAKRRRPHTAIRPAPAFSKSAVRAAMARVAPNGRCHRRQGVRRWRGRCRRHGDGHGRRNQYGDQRRQCRWFCVRDRRQWWRQL
jgi:hypothetical protein